MHIHQIVICERRELCTVRRSLLTAFTRGQNVTFHVSTAKLKEAWKVISESSCPNTRLLQRRSDAGMAPQSMDSVEGRVNALLNYFSLFIIISILCRFDASLWTLPFSFRPCLTHVFFSVSPNFASTTHFCSYLLTTR